MFGTDRLSARAPGLQIFALSVLALLALACFPMFAQAASGEVPTYEDAVPTVTGNKAPKDRKTPNGSANASDGDTKADGGSGAAGSNSSGGSGSGSSSQSGGTGKGDTAQQGSPGKDAGKGSPGDAKPGAIVPSPTSSEDDGSSPLLPILIAILVLAAISIAVVLIRQRRRREASDSSGSDSSGSPVSPEAG